MGDAFSVPFILSWSKLKSYILYDYQTVVPQINKLDRDYSHQQILPLVCPLKYHVTLLLSHYPKARAKKAGIVNKVYYR